MRSSCHLMSALRTPRASSSWAKYLHCVLVNFLDMKAPGWQVCHSSPCAIRAPMPAGHASVITQTLSLVLSSLERFSSGFHWIGFRIGVLHARCLILSKHFWWSGVHLNCCFFMQMVCSGLV